MKRIISIFLIICSLKCISNYTQITGMYSIADNHDKHSEVSASICGIQVSYDFHFPFDRINAEVEQEEESEEEPDEKINNEPYKELDKETLKEQAVLAYKKFMDGRCSSVGGSNIYSLAMPTGEPDRRYPTGYAIIDVNGDGIPELNIQTAREFNVYSFENGEITFLGLFMPSLYGYCILKNGAYMYYSDRWSTCYYRYFELDGEGNEINEISFSWDENNGNYIPDEEDDFFFNGNACTMEEWHDMTREYLYTDEDGREQIRNQVEWTLYCEADPFEINDQMLYYERKNGYQLTLYDKEHNEILSEHYPESMWIDGVSEDVLEIGISVGNPANYTYYFNQETAEISDTFFNAIVVGDKYIAYMEDDAVNKEERTLILSDIFKEGILHQEITRDFSKTADPMSAIISIEMIDSENIRLEYYKGETYTIESEIIGVIFNDISFDEIIAEVEYEEDTSDVSPVETFIDYDYIEQYHEILFHNICDSPKEDYSNTVLAEYLKEDIEKDKKLIEADSEEGRPLTIDYHLFDFNDDGMEDYLVCLRGTFWSQEGKDTVRIYMQEKNGTLRKVFEDYIYCCTLDYYVAVAVLADRVEGYHLLAVAETNSLLRYNKKSGWYEFCEIESNTYELTKDEIHAGMTAEEYSEKKEMYENIKHVNMSAYIDYEFIEEKHKILRHNICISPRNDYENTPLKEYLADDVESDRQHIENAREMMEREKISVIPLYIDYFSFDFNDDGLEDYLVCYHGGLWSGSGGNHVAIYIQESNGLLSEVFSITMRLHNEYAWPNEHSPMAILDEKDDGYYAFVLVGNNHIVRYNKEKGRYVF